MFKNLENTAGGLTHFFSKHFLKLKQPSWKNMLAHFLEEEKKSYFQKSEMFQQLFYFPISHKFYRGFFRQFSVHDTMKNFIVPNDL